MASASAIFASWRLWSAAGCKRPQEWGDPPRTDGRLDLDRWEPLVAWVVLLGDVTDGELEQARIEIARTVAPWWPTIPQVLEAVRRGRTAAEPPRLAAEDAFATMLVHLSSYLRDEDAYAALPEADRADVRAVFDSFGGRARCGDTWLERDIPHHRREFVRALEARRARSTQGEERETAGRLLDLRRGVLRLVDGGGR